MAVIGSFRELKVWQRGMELCLDVYHLTDSFPQEEIYGITAQLRRTAVSLPSSIAAGWGRRNRDDFKSFLIATRAANLELQTQLEICRRLSFGASEQLTQVEEKSREVGKLLARMIRRL